MKYFDAHTHVQFDPYDADREELLAKMREEEVGGLIVGVDLESSRRALALVEGKEGLYAAMGLHPNREEEEWFTPEPYRELAKSPKIVAIGECGLDYYRPLDASDEVKRKQRNVLEDHIQLALELDKPLMIHSRPTKGTQDAYRDLIAVLESYKKEQGEKLRGDIHFFVGGVEEAKQFVDLGFTMSFTAVLTFTHDYDEVVKYLPVENILSETDAPYVAPASRRGQRNDPLSVKDVVAAIAGIRNENEDIVRETVLGNARRLFGI